MPVTLNIVDHPAVDWRLGKVATSEELLEGTSDTLYRHSRRILQSSFSRRRLRENHISASENGFVWSACTAYSKHHHLVIRPDDVWLAVLTQLSFYIKANAEKLRAFFVSHEGRKKRE